MELRDYQQKLIADIREAVNSGHRRILMQLVTGGGKTIIASSIIRDAIADSGKSLFICDRREILFQTVDKLERFGVETGVMLSGDPYDSSLSSIVASIPTFHSWVVRRKHEGVPPAHVVFTDEAHSQSSAKTWQDIHSLYPHSIHIGMTATPINAKGKGLGEHFDVMVKGPSYKEAIAAGWLVKPKYYVPSIPDLSAVKIVAGDYQKDQLEKAMNKPKLIGDVFTNLDRIAPGKKTMIFTTGVKHSIDVAAEGTRRGLSCAHVDGKTDKGERDRILADYRAGKIQVLSNCGIYVKGADIPDIEVLVLDCPTKSLVKYLQVIGRALRPWPGKEFATIIDHSGAVYEHGPVEQDWDWKLTYNDQDLEKRFKMKKEHEKRAITCKNCHFMFEGTITCPACGTRVERKGKPVATYEAYLQELEAEEIEKQVLENKEWYLQIRGFAAERNFKNPDGWSAWTYKHRFGTWPGNFWKSMVPKPPSSKVRNYCWERIKAARMEWKSKQPYQTSMPNLSTGGQ